MKMRKTLRRRCIWNQQDTLPSLLGWHSSRHAVYMVQMFPDFLGHMTFSAGIFRGIRKSKEIPNNYTSKVIRSKPLPKCLCPNISVAIWKHWKKKNDLFYFILFFFILFLNNHNYLTGGTCLLGVYSFLYLGIWLNISTLTPFLHISFSPGTWFPSQQLLENQVCKYVTSSKDCFEI